ncbi:Nop15p [Lipomyces japonicus]|uniref:Nop15p n=1 Tax=Lipomyces japonicus TaxID=56871 RepID=UPI0034CEAA56
MASKKNSSRKVQKYAEKNVADKKAEKVTAKQVEQSPYADDKTEKKTIEENQEEAKAVEEAEEEEEFTGFGSGSDEDNDDEVSGDEGAAVPETVKKELKLSTEKESQIRELVSRVAKKTKKRDEEEEPGVLYVGRIPHGFYEEQMRAYFSQFGDILRLRLSRNKKSGASKHYAFIEFGSKEVAQIVADTMNNYLLYGHILKVSVVPKEKVHEKLFQGANRKFKAIPTAKLAKNKHDKKRNNEEVEKLIEREQKRRKAKHKQLSEAGIDYCLPKSQLKTTN